MYGSVVLKIEGYHFEELIENYKLTKRCYSKMWNWKKMIGDGLIENFKEIVKEKLKKIFLRM